MTKTPVPKTIGRYEIVREIGRGAMGVVYEGRDLSLMRPVALKTLLLEPLAEELREPFEKRFYQEARAAAGLQHPSIVVVYEIGIDAAADAFFITLEYLKGRTLEDVIAEGPLSWRDALKIAGRLGDALAHAHENGIVHRDVKPGNVMILKKNEPMLYEALTRKRAFGKGTFSEIMMRLAYEQPTPPSHINGDIPEVVDDILAHAMAKSPDQRYANADQMVEDIEDALSDRPLRHTRGAGSTGVAPALPPKPPGSATTGPGQAPAPQSPAATAPSGDASGKSAGLPRGPLTLPEGKRVSLAFLSGPKEGSEYVLRHASLLIGREGGNSGAGIELSEGLISRMHAMVEARGQRFVLRDLDSKNGTYVDETRIREVEIESGSEFRIGSTRFRLVVAEA